MKYSISELRELIKEYGNTITERKYNEYEEVYATYGEIMTGYPLDFITWLERREAKSVTND